MTLTRRRFFAAGACIALTLAAGVQAHNSGAASGARTSLTQLVGASPGGGWDTVARELQHSMRENSIVSNPRVLNAPGAAGTIGLEQLFQMDGKSDMLMVTGTVMVGGIAVNNTPHKLTDTKPIARLADDYEAIVVPADSEFQTLEQLMDAVKKNPGSISFGGGSLGGTDHLLAGLLAQEIGVSPTEINYVPFAGGGDAISALLSRSVTAGVSGYIEFSDQVEAGNLRLLGIAAPEPVEGVPGPTLKEAGYSSYLPNWRGLVAPPGITDEERDELVAIVRETTNTAEWQDTLARNRWVDSYQDGPEFEEFINNETERIQEIIKELGL